MIFSLTIPRSGRNAISMTAIAIGYASMIATGLHSYIHFVSINFLLGILAIIVTWRIDYTRAKSGRFGWLSLLFVLLYVMVPAKTLLFASIGCGLFFLAETFIGRISLLTVITLFYMSPIFEYLTNVFSFPLRLQLTQLAGALMQLTKSGIHAEGNMLLSDGTEYSVDPVCIGLHMFSASLLAGVIISGIYERRLGKQLSVRATIMIAVIIVALNIASNLLRIISLVTFRILPGSILHSVMGLCCFTGYVLIPSVMLIRHLVRRSAKELPGAKQTSNVPTLKLLQNGLLLMVIVLATMRNRDLTANAVITAAPVTVPGYSSMQLEDHVTKLNNGEALIYVKPIAGFFSSDHQPMMCWTGSGYEFKNIQEQQMGNVRVYSAALEKGNDKLYSAWWYDSGSEKTISQMEWRWHAFSTSAQYSLINVTTASAASLQKEVERFASMNTLKTMTRR